MRKYLTATAALLATVGLSLAGEVVFVGYNAGKKELTVKDGDKTVKYVVTEDTKVRRGDKDAKLENVLKYFESKAQEGYKFEVTADKANKLTEIKLPAKK